MTFEEKLARLEEISNKLENEVLPLEESLKLYEEGKALIKELSDFIDNAEKNIKKVVEVE